MDDDSASVNAFCKILIASGLVSSDGLAPLVRDYKTACPDTSSQCKQGFSDFLVSRGVITQWQAEKLLVGRYKGFVIDSYLLLDRVCICDDFTTFSALDTVRQQRVLLDIWGHPSAVKIVNSVTVLGFLVSLHRGGRWHLRGFGGKNLHTTCHLQPARYLKSLTKNLISELTAEDTEDRRGHKLSSLWFIRAKGTQT